MLSLDIKTWIKNKKKGVIPETYTITLQDLEDLVDFCIAEENMVTEEQGCEEVLETVTSRVMKTSEVREWIKIKRAQNGENVGPPTSFETKNLLNFVEDLVDFLEMKIIEEKEND